VFFPRAPEPGRADLDGAATHVVVEDAAAPSADALRPVPGAPFAAIPVDAIRPHPRPPRQAFDEGELEERQQSSRQIGPLQPGVGRPLGGEPAAYELVRGERRGRATRMAGLETSPAIVRETDESDLLRDALLENLHRS